MEFWKNEGSCLGRFKNRNEARKKVMNSWERDLSIGNVKWSLRRHKYWVEVSKLEFLSLGFSRV